MKDPILGSHDWVVNFDLNSLYPHLIMQYNLSPETLITDELPSDLQEIKDARPGIDGLVDQVQNLDALKKYAYGFGIAFQIVDDLLDVEGDIGTTGKPGGQDAKVEKATLVAKLGVEEARHKAVFLVNESIEALKLWGTEADHLRSLAQFVLERQK